MRLRASLLSCLVTALGVTSQRTCGTPAPLQEHGEVSRVFRLTENANGLAKPVPININIYWHVVAANETVDGGFHPQSTLDRQLAVMNGAFAPHDVQFTQVGADWTINASWAAESPVSITMKKALRKGTYADLNIYFIPDTPLLGFASWPDAVVVGSDEFYMDGVVIRAASVPGGSLSPYNGGHTATHETGHWLGLYHTFQGDECGGDGDFVDDTPFEAEEAFGCPIGRDTCPDLPGADPVTNYMDYSDDACFTHFTSGQGVRMHSFWDKYRAQYQ
ncbi:metalloprotease [Colletotrichum tamarilloi]|uniref:Metalloprotease n=1 Tax=Colletotrichum tamarilloi TaxID=1209934 RepID=A0ABQ9QHZ2_9PEZI|nr:metalloprotease [Colletotrichum tamarilloi]KAK1471173.1 metalloprotease [Colletotrichum tamarilloi]